MSEAQRPKIGVGVVIHDGAGNIIMGERAGSHGAGTSLSNETINHDTSKLGIRSVMQISCVLTPLRNISMPRRPSRVW